MNILAIIGSPRAGGNTFKTVQIAERLLKEKDETVSFEYIELSRYELKNCRGCGLCISVGEEKCPLKDGREALELRMKQADALIFASPVYNYNVSWVMKNFFDRFSYRCHRPDFTGKKAMVLATTGSVGLGFVTMLISSILGTMGFEIIASAGLTYPPPHEKDDLKREKELRKLKKQTDRFYKAITNDKPLKPSLIKRYQFKKQREAFIKSPPELADYRFFKGKGWFDGKSPWQV